MRVAVLLACTLGGCAYKPGSFTHIQQSFPGMKATVGCLDVAVERRTEVIGGGAVIAYAFGNRCDGPAVVDLRGVSVVGRTSDGREVLLQPFDPNGEIIPLQIDGRTVGKEAIEYPTETFLAEVCVDVASLAHTAPAEWRCLASNITGDHVAVAP